VTITVDPLELRAEPGGPPVSTTVKVRNDGTKVEHFILVVNGLVAPYARIDPQDLNIYPGDEQAAQVHFAVPRTPRPAAGRVPFEIAARASVDADVHGRVAGAVTIGRFDEISAVLEPEMTRGRKPGHHRLTVVNKGNAPLNVQVVLADQQGELTFHRGSGRTGDELAHVIRPFCGCPVDEAPVSRRRGERSRETAECGVGRSAGSAVEGGVGIGGQQNNPAEGPGRPTVYVHCGVHPSRLSGKCPETARRETPMSTAITCGADTTRISNDAECDSTSVSSLVRIREIGPGDGAVVDEVFAGLSPRSRYLRFQAPVAELSAATRRSLTSLDGCTHVALAAFCQGRPIGIVRIIDLGGGRGELAVEVVDRWQGCGVGTELLLTARNRAAELGYRELVGEMLVVNGAVHAALAASSGSCVFVVMVRS
jgi:GNAT superfamily N-acetyltransferase